MPRPETSPGAVWRRIGALAAIAAVVGGSFWLKTRDDGNHWDDVDVGQCVSGFESPVVRQMMGGGYSSNTALDCSSPKANYVVISQNFDTHITCPDGDKDKTANGRYVMKHFDGRRSTSSTFHGAMCLAPNLHVGRCYSPGEDRGGLVSSVDECHLLTWQVTRRIDGVSDINRCAPATGLVLSQPPVTYCEVVYDDQAVPESMRKFSKAKPPPAG
ncbi:hypothetical protein AAFP30_12035 [Gordonia sp. CPCC 205515]|uniref:hypothetical protein n=1 Tax=Gordonia sp. CPCC 205515 TaxID=3140791 RepID=UPI003AF37F6D